MTNANRNRFAGRVQDQVIIARQNAGWRREYMDWKMTLLNERIKGREEGLAEGLETGLTRGLLLSQINIIKKNVQKGIDLSEIAEDMGMDVDSIRPVWEAVKAAAPEYDQEKILEVLIPLSTAQTS